MALLKRYRSFLIVGLSCVSLFTAACGDMQKQPTMKKEMNQKWYTGQVQIQLQLATQQYAVGDYTKCRKTLDDALAICEARGVFLPGLEMLYGKLDIEKGSLETAAEHLKSACNMSPADPEPYYLLGVVYQRWQKMEVAADYYQQAWDKKSTEARYMLAVIEMKLTLGQVDEAEQILNDKMVYFEQTAAVRVALARIATLRGDYVAASKHYRDAFVLVPDDDNIRRSYAESLFYAGKYAEAVARLEDLKNTRAATPSPEAPDAPAAAPETEEAAASHRTTLALMLGQCYLELHRTTDARACYQDVIREHADNMQAVLGLGKVCVETNELPAALAAGRRVLRSDPQDVQAMILVAMVQQKQKKWSEALSTLESAVAAAPKDSTVLCMAGVSQQKLGKAEEATIFFEKAVAANPHDTWAVELLQHVRGGVPVPSASIEKPTAVGATDSSDTLTTAQPSHIPAGVNAP